MEFTQSVKQQNKLKLRHTVDKLPEIGFPLFYSGMYFIESISVSLHYT